MSCETIKVRSLNEFQRGNPEVTYVSDTCIRNYILGLRLYLDGAYVDPPSEVLSPTPKVQVENDSWAIL